MGAPHRPALGRKTILEYPNGRFVCYCCESEFGLTALDEHHKIPQEIGGSDDPTNIASLCNGCHQTLHRLGFQLVSVKSKAKSALEVAEDYASSVRHRDPKAMATRLLELAVLQAQAKTLKASGAVAPPDGEIIVSNFPAKYKALLIQAGKEVKDSRGRRLGMNNIVAVAALDYLAKRHPELEKEMREWSMQNLFYGLRTPARTLTPAVFDDFDPVF